jgi:hypothetical protein
MNGNMLRVLPVVLVLLFVSCGGSGDDDGGPGPSPSPWSSCGTGDTVFDMPTRVERVKIAADYSEHSSNFIAHIGGDLVVNELIGTGFDSTHFEGTYLTDGGVAEITHSSGVRWCFTEVR